MKSRIVLAGVVAVSLSVLANPVLAKQCVYNKAGFILDVAWMYKRPVISGGRQVYIPTVARKDSIPTLQGTCINGNILFYAMLSVRHGEIAHNFTLGAIASSLTFLGAVMPGISPGSIAAGVVAGSASGASTLLQKILPNPKNTFYAGYPSPYRYLDVWGTIWNPQYGLGGPIR